MPRAENGSYYSSSDERAPEQPKQADNPVGLYHNRHKFPQHLSTGQEQLLFKAIHEGMDLTDIQGSTSFWEPIKTDEDTDKFLNAFSQSTSLEDLAALCNLGLIGREAKKYPSSNYEDNWQEGYFGLRKAIKSFDPERGLKFSGFATKCISNAITDAFKEKGYHFRLPENVAGMISHTKKAAEQYKEEHGVPPPKEIWKASVLAAHEKTKSWVVDAAIEVITSGKLQEVRSLEAPLDSNSNDTLLDVLSDTKIDIAPSLQEIPQGPLRKAFKKILTPKEEHALRLYFGLDRHRPQRNISEIAQLFKVTEKTVERWRKSALKKLAENPLFIDLYQQMMAEKESEPHKKRIFSPEHRAEISKAKKGKQVSPEEKESMRLRMTGTIRTPETRAKISATKKGRPGKPLSPETKAKLSEIRTGRIFSPETREKLALAAREREARKREAREKEKLGQSDAFTQIFPDAPSHE